MTHEEASIIANRCDIETMLELSSYYNSKKTYEDTEWCVFWSEKAALKDSPDGVMRTAFGYPILATINSTRMVGEYDEAKRQWISALTWCQVALEMVEIDDQLEEEVKETIEMASYGAAICSYMTKNYADAITYAQKASGIRAQLVRGCSIFAQANDTGALGEAYDVLQVLEFNSDYFDSVKKLEDENDKDIFVKAVHCLARIYRLGISGKVAVDLDKAVDILKRAENALIGDPFKQQIEEDLGHYKKKLFGGYKYIE